MRTPDEKPEKKDRLKWCSMCEKNIEPIVSPGFRHLGCECPSCGCVLGIWKLRE